MEWITQKHQVEPWLALFGLLLCVGFLWLLLRGITRIVRRRSERRRCRWKRDRTKGSGSLTAWTCRSCGVLAYSATRRAPVDCKAALRPRPL